MLHKDCIEPRWDDPSTRVLLLRPSVHTVHYLRFFENTAISKFNLVVHRYTGKWDVLVLPQLKLALLRNVL
jgi:hypothetical protein